MNTKRKLSTILAAAALTAGIVLAGGAAPAQAASGTNSGYKTCASNQRVRISQSVASGGGALLGYVASVNVLVTALGEGTESWTSPNYGSQSFKFVGAAGMQYSYSVSCV